MRTTLYADAGEERRALAHSAPLLVPVVNTPAGRHQSGKRLSSSNAGDYLPLPGLSDQVVLLAACN
jgi:hypothetical protein